MVSIFFLDLATDTELYQAYRDYARLKKRVAKSTAAFIELILIDINKELERRG